MMNRLLFLEWDNHKGALTHNLNKLRLDEIFCDATVVCNGEHFPVHKLVLYNCSVYFQEIFRDTHCKYPFIILKDVEGENFSYLLDFMYKGNIKVPERKLLSLLQTAEYLKIKGLAVSEDFATPEIRSTRKTIKSIPIKNVISESKVQSNLELVTTKKRKSSSESTATDVKEVQVDNYEKSNSRKIIQSDINQSNSELVLSKKRKLFFESSTIDIKNETTDKIGFMSENLIKKENSKSNHKINQSLNSNKIKLEKTEVLHSSYNDLNTYNCKASIKEEKSEKNVSMNVPDAIDSDVEIIESSKELQQSSSKNLSNCVKPRLKFTLNSKQFIDLSENDANNSNSEDFNLFYYSVSLPLNKKTDISKTVSSQGNQESKPLENDELLSDEYILELLKDTSSSESFSGFDTPTQNCNGIEEASTETDLDTQQDFIDVV
ncbi:UNVERIFIED_CONTAM: hypothetical protein GTU68_009473 [Idotea baltica]|nr:hypothetical protein [Idotea baltica]